MKRLTFFILLLLLLIPSIVFSTTYYGVSFNYYVAPATGSGTFYPAASGDDGYWRAGIAFDNSSNDIPMGDIGGDNYNVFYRFTNVTIPVGATITSAYITFTGYILRDATTCNITIDFSDVDDASAPASFGDCDALVGTGLTVAWNNLATWTDGGTYNSPDLTTPLQDIVSRVGWASGNDVLCFIMDNSSSGSAHRSASSYDYSGAAEKATLYVEWTNP